MSPLIALRVSDEQRADLEWRAANASTNLSAYIRSAIWGPDPPNREDRPEPPPSAAVVARQLRVPLPTAERLIARRAVKMVDGQAVLR